LTVSAGGFIVGLTENKKKEVLWQDCKQTAQANELSHLSGGCGLLSVMAEGPEAWTNWAI